MFGPDPLTTVCTNCQAQITTGLRINQPKLLQAPTLPATTDEVGVMAWVAAGLMCALGQLKYIVYFKMTIVSGLWCCAPIPLCIDSLRVGTIISSFFRDDNSCTGCDPPLP